MKDMELFNDTSDRGMLNFDLLQDFIADYQPTLPGPPPPPADLIDNGEVQQPRLVPRGTACQPPRSFPQPLPQSCSSRRMAHSSRGSSYPATGSRSSPSLSSQNSGNDTEMLERILDKPKLVVVEEPKERGMRFRYECEGRSAGSILGTSSTESNKTQPAIEIQGPIEHIKRVTVTASLVTKDPPHRPHPHCLVGKDCPNTSGICVVTLNPHSSRCHSFSNLGIQCVKRKDLDSSLEKRRSLNIDPFQTGHSKGIEDMDMNAVRLCFECELEWDDGRKDSLSPVISNPIYDKKATTTSQLKISCLNIYRGPCTGKTEIYMLCDKVQKDDIEIIFRRGSWKASGEFAQTDVHRQIAIVFKTPPYQDQDIVEEVEVSVALRRLSDQMESEPVSFTYLPYNPDPYEVNRKRKIKPDVNFREKSCATAESAPAVESPLVFPQPQTMTSTDDLHCAAQPGVAPSAEMCFPGTQDSNSDLDSLAIVTELLENPAYMRIFDQLNLNPTLLSGSEQMLDVNAMTSNMDVNFNQSYGSYHPDFSHFSDLQFSALFNESQTQQTDAQDTSANVVQVKTEDESCCQPEAPSGRPLS
ncbi:transcription factor RelB isoform X1 [Xyrichtys novacula]|uniref:Transcription factor RelB isoform X1 n=1 Tax=Xyrichtys novacula TaxID=13765 RepID=A0AAV1FX91_XYRNO|nr:transcription factor RelB isoform X1 [Xyrichtys novacula]